MARDRNWSVGVTAIAPINTNADANKPHRIHRPLNALRPTQSLAISTKYDGRARRSSNPNLRRATRVCRGRLDVLRNLLTRCQCDIHINPPQKKVATGSPRQDHDLQMG